MFNEAWLLLNVEASLLSFERPFSDSVILCDIEVTILRSLDEVGSGLEGAELEREELVVGFSAA